MAALSLASSSRVGWAGPFQNGGFAITCTTSGARESTTHAQPPRVNNLHMGTSLMKKRHPLGPYSRRMRRALWRSKGTGRFLMGEVTLHPTTLSR